jgi:L-amino acid N-acyltransferase YncA
MRIHIREAHHEDLNSILDIFNDVMMAAIDATNQESIRLHKRFGFEVCGDIKQVARKFDSWLDLILMQKIL